jgi:urea transport system permease protein
MGKLPIAAVLAFAGGLLAWMPGPAAAPLDRAAKVKALCGDASSAGEAAAGLIAGAASVTREDAAFAAALVEAMLAKRLLCPAEPGEPVTVKAGTAVVDAVTGAPATTPPRAKPPVVSLKNRAAFETLGAAYGLLASPDLAQRAGALDTLARKPDALPAGFFERAAEAEKDPALAERIGRVAELAALSSPDLAKRIPAIERLAANPNRRTMTVLDELRREAPGTGDARYIAALDAASAKVGRAILAGDALSTLYNGLSFASILFMASIGLAIIFGLMGVINLAQGEFIMIGAYVTYLVQEALRLMGPAYAEWYLFVAIPFAFGVTALVGIALEATLIRHLYRRPLMSLLATWAVSLALVNLVRIGFGTQNLQMITPAYVSGGIPVVGDFLMTWNRLFAIGFAAVTLAATFALIRFTGLGLDIRAVTQNRSMAGCIGIPTRRVDMLAFGFGSGLAGLAGLALSPIYNVNPQMGTQFIIDSFMVVVLGGVGSIAGTVVAAFGVGQINVLIEPIWGAVAAKVIVLGLIIGFLQWRPEGLFAIAGRRR